jgi:hypothetical protein
VVGGAVSGVLVLALIGAFLFWLLRRRRRRRAYELGYTAAMLDPYHIDSSLEPSSFSAVQTTKTGWTGSTEAGATSLVTPNLSKGQYLPFASTSSLHASDRSFVPPHLTAHELVPDSELAGMERNASHTQNTGRPTVVHHHQDSGLRMPSGQIESDIIDVPPAYTTT